MSDLALELLKKHKKPTEDVALELLKKHKKPTEDIALELLKKHKKLQQPGETIAEKEEYPGEEKFRTIPPEGIAPKEAEAYYTKTRKEAELEAEAMKKPYITPQKFVENMINRWGEKIYLIGEMYQVSNLPVGYDYGWDGATVKITPEIKKEALSYAVGESAKEVLRLGPGRKAIAGLSQYWLPKLNVWLHTRNVSVKETYDLIQKAAGYKSVTGLKMTPEETTVWNSLGEFVKKTGGKYADLLKLAKKGVLKYNTATNEIYAKGVEAAAKVAVPTKEPIAEAAAIKAIAKPGATAHDLRNIVIPKAPAPPTEQALLPSSVPAVVHDIIDKQRVLQGNLLSATKELRELTPGTASYIEKATTIKQIEKDMHKVVIEIGKEYKLPKEAEKAISEIDGNMDLLSEVYNRARFSRDLANNFVKGNFLTFADVDDFKIFNDKYGHLVGDQVVESIGKGIKESLNKLGLSKEVIPYRFGGDEFVIISKKSLTTEQVKEINTSINETFKKLQPDVEENIKISWGKPVPSKDCKNPSEWIDTADKEMYRVKQAAKEMKPPEEPPTGAVPAKLEPTPPTKPPATTIPKFEHSVYYYINSGVASKFTSAKQFTEAIEKARTVFVKDKALDELSNFKIEEEFGSLENYYDWVKTNTQNISKAITTYDKFIDRLPVDNKTKALWKKDPENLELNLRAWQETKPPTEKDVAMELLEKHKKPDLEMKAKEVKIEKPAPKVTQETITGKPYIPPKDATGVEIERQKMADTPLFDAAGEKGAEQLRLGTQKPPEDLAEVAKAVENIQSVIGKTETVEGKEKFYSPFDGEEISKEEDNLYEIIKREGGIKSYEKVAGEKPLREEYREVPIHLRKKGGLALDEMADVLKNRYPQFGVSSEADLITALHNYRLGGGMEMGFVRFEPIIKAYTTVHDWMFTHGEMRRVDPQMYNQLMLRFSRYNAAVEKATSKADQSMMRQKVTPLQKMEMAIIYEDKTYNPRPEYREVYNNLAKLNQAIERASLRKGIIERPFQERMIEEHEKEIQLLRQERITPGVTVRIEELSVEIEKFKNMRYLPHQIVVKRAIEAKLNRLTGEEKKIFIDKLTRLSAKFHIRKGKKLLLEYFDEGILTTKDVDFLKLTIDNLNSYYQKSAMKDLYDVAIKKGYIQPMSQRLLDEGWYKSDEVGIIAPELKRKVIHPLFANALNEIKALKLGSRGNIARQVFGAVKVAQFIKPSIIWVYDVVQKVIRGMYSLNPVREVKFAAEATNIILTANTKYHQLNKLNLYQFPAETPRAVKEEMIKMAVRKADATIPGWVKILEKITNTSWAKGDISPTDLLMLPYRTLAHLTWTGDKIIRTSSVLALEKMGYPTEEASQIAARGHGAYSELSPHFKKAMAPLFFVHSFRVLMPMEIAKVLTNPVKEVLKAKFSGEKIPKYRLERMAKAIIGTILIPIIAELYMKARGFERDKLMWKWKKVVVDPKTGKKAEVVVTLNNIINMPAKWLHRLTYYNPIDPTPRGLQGVKNWYKWEAHPLTRIFFWDILENRRSFGDMEQVFDPNTNFINKHWQIAKYVFGQAFRFHGLALEAVDAGNLTLKEKKDQEKCLDLALSDFEKVLFGKHLGVLGYAYVRQNKQKQGQIWTSVLIKEYQKRLFNLLIKYEEGPERNKAEQSIHSWFKKCQLWIAKTFSYDVESHKEPEPKKDVALELLEKHKK